MTYASVLTFVDGSSASLERARTATRIAESFDARLTGVFPRPPLPVSAWDEPFYWGMPPVIPPAVPPEIMAEHERRTDARTEEARLGFQRAGAAAGCRSDWIVGPADDGAGALALMRRTDLVVLPPDRLPTVGPTGTPAADLALDAGGPALILPEGADAPAGHALVAWNGSREAARAVRDAWPFLARAEAVHVVVVGSSGADEPDPRLQRYFEEHGCAARLVVERQVDAPVADVLLRQAQVLGADLMVMGLYGHSRLRETILGGVSRDVLRRCPVATLVSH